MVVLCIPPARCAGCSTISDAGSLCTEIPRRGGQSPSPSLPLPWAVSQLSPQEAVSSRPFPLWQFSGLPAVPVLGCLPLSAANRMLLLHQFSGFHSCSGSRLEGICVCVCFLLFYFLFCLCFCCCCCCSIYTFQTCHAGPPLPPTAVRPPYKETVRANKKQTMYREISKCIQRNVLLQRQYRGPPGAHYCSWWDKAGRELLSWLPGDGESRKGKKKKESLQEVQFSYFLNYQLYISIRDKEINLAPSVVPKSHLFQWIAHWYLKNHELFGGGCLSNSGSVYLQEKGRMAGYVLLSNSGWGDGVEGRGGGMMPTSLTQYIRMENQQEQPGQHPRGSLLHFWGAGFVLLAKVTATRIHFWQKWPGQESIFQ